MGPSDGPGGYTYVPSAGIANIVCSTVFPMSAASRLQKSIAKSLSSFSTLLDLLTSTFLLEKTVVKGTKTNLKDAVQSHATAFKTLKSDLGEAKHERVLDPRIRGRKLELYDAAIGSLTRLAQHLAGLRGSTRLQESLIHAIREGRISADIGPEKRFSTMSVSTLKHDRSPGPATMQDADIAGSIHLFVQFREIAGEQMDTLVVRLHDGGVLTVVSLRRCIGSCSGGCETYRDRRCRPVNYPLSSRLLTHRVHPIVQSCHQATICWTSPRQGDLRTRWSRC